MDDRKHIATLERLLAKAQKYRRMHADHLREFGEYGVKDTSKTMLQCLIDECCSETDALEWALEKLTRSDR